MTIFVYKALTRNPVIGNMSEFRPITGDWGKLGTPNLAGFSLRKTECCKMPGLQLLPFLR